MGEIFQSEVNGMHNMFSVMIGYVQSLQDDMIRKIAFRSMRQTTRKTKREDEREELLGYILIVVLYVFIDDLFRFLLRTVF